MRGHPFRWCVVAGLLLLAAVIASGCKSSTSRPAAAPVADIVILDAAVYTMAPGMERAEAVAITGDRIVLVGSNGDAERLVGDETRVLRVAGAMVLPGFHDAHVHLVTGGVEYLQCNLNDLNSREAVVAEISRYAAAHPDVEWIVGGGWDLPLYPAAGPTRQELDAIVPDRPVYLTSADGHSAWVNTVALERAGVDAGTRVPPGGRIVREAGGAPSGALRETAMDLVARHIPEPTRADYLAGLRLGMERAHRFGITSIQDASASEEVLAAYHAQAERGELSLRVVAAQRLDLDRGVDHIRELVTLREKYRGANFRAGAVKIFLDGVIEAKTAALIEPYLGGGKDRGELNVEPAKLRELAIALVRAEFDIHIHAIGDRAIRTALDALEGAGTAARRKARHTIAHLQLIAPADMARFAELGVVANFQPLWAYADRYIRELTIPVLGRERSAALYPIGSVARSGAHIAAGSDWTVSSMNPLDAIQVAVTRQSLKGDTEVWLPGERVDLETILRAYTVGGAYLNRSENETGTLEAGKAADLVVLSRDLHAVPPAEIHETSVVLTIAGGRIVYECKTEREGEGERSECADRH